MFLYRMEPTVNLDALFVPLNYINMLYNIFLMGNPKKSSNDTSLYHWVNNINPVFIYAAYCSTSFLIG